MVKIVKIACTCITPLTLYVGVELVNVLSLQASKHCADSKDYLEMMCRDMAEELAHFDLQKEKELKQVLLEYTAAQLERHEKVRLILRTWYICRLGGYKSARKRDWVCHVQFWACCIVDVA